jgi:hypothetical protein
MTTQMCRTSGEISEISILEEMTQSWEQESRDSWCLLRMAQDIRENGSKIKTLDKEKESKFGLMAQCMKGGGLTIRQMERVDSFMLMETYTMVIGKMIKLMGLESTLI